MQLSRQTRFLQATTEAKHQRASLFYALKRGNCRVMDGKRRPDKDNSHTKKGVFNSSSIDTLNISHCFEYEFLYLRSNDIPSFNLLVTFPQLKVLDLSGNSLSSWDYLEWLPNLKHLFVGCNRYSSFEGFPPLRFLETLSVSGNPLISFDGLPELPSLQLLNVRSSRISTFKSFPRQSRLESLSLSDSLLTGQQFYRQTAIALCDSHALRLLDGQEVVAEERLLSSIFSGRVMEALREGFIISDSQNQQEIEESASSFLISAMRLRTRESPLQLVTMAITHAPEEGQNVIMTPIFEIKDTLSVLLSPSFERKDVVVNSDADKVVLHFTDISGTVTLARQGQNTHTTSLYLPAGEYNCLLEHIGNRVETTQLVLKIEKTHQDAVDYFDIQIVCNWEKNDSKGVFSMFERAHPLECLAGFSDIGLCYKPVVVATSKEGHELFRIFHVSTPIHAGRPRCIAIKLSEEQAEGETVTAFIKYAGGEEGDSIIRWYRVTEDQTILLGDNSQKKYTFCIDDVGHKIKVEYTPIRSDGAIGETVEIESELILPAPPMVKSLDVIGDPQEGQQLQIRYSYYGGLEGESRIKWLRETSCDEYELITINSLTYTPTLADVGCKIRVEYTPVSTTDATGKAAVCTTSAAVAPASPTITAARILGNLFEGEQLTIEYEYNGGHEGDSQVHWQTVNGSEVLRSLENSNNYVLSAGDIGFTVRAAIIPKRADAVSGEAFYVSSVDAVQAGKPKVECVKIIGSAEINKVLSVTSVYFGGTEGSSIVKWYKKGEEDNDFVEYSETEAASQNTLQLRKEDAYSMIKVGYTPVRNDGVTGDTAFDMVGPIMPAPPEVVAVIITGEPMEGCVLKGEFEVSGRCSAPLLRWLRKRNAELEEIADENVAIYKLKEVDIGCQLRFEVQPVREDGARGVTATSEWTASIRPILPSIEGTSFHGEMVQDSKISVSLVGSLLDEEKCKFAWYRINEKSEETFTGEASSEYTCLLEDVDKTLKCLCTPVRSVGVEGEPYVALTSKICPASPVAKSIDIVVAPAAIELSVDSVLEVKTEYYGGFEGESRLRWFRVDEDNISAHIPEMDNCVRYQLTSIDYNKRLRVEYTPVRSDGVEGDTVISESEMLRDKIPTASGGVIDGRHAEGEMLTGSVEVVDSTGGVPAIRWLRIYENGDVMDTGVSEARYQVQLDDVYTQLRFEYTPRSITGLTGTPVVVNTEIIQPLPPTASNVTIQGDCRVSSIVSVTAEYRGGKQGNSEFVWMRSVDQQPFVIIPGATSLNYYFTADDAECRVKAVFTPCRADGVQGQPVESASVSVPLGAGLQDQVIQNLTAGEYTVELNQLTPKQKASMINVTAGRVKIGSKSVPLPNAKIALVLGEESDFAIIGQKHNCVLRAANREQRDFIVLVLRGFSLLSAVAQSSKDFARSWKRNERDAVAAQFNLAIQTYNKNA